MVIERELPDDLTGMRVLAIVAEGDAAKNPTDGIASRGAAHVETAAPQALPEDGDFGLFLCRDALRVTPHPMALLTDLRRLAAPGATLLLEAEVLPDSERSQYARFIEDGPRRGWIPGRLALRWMVETAGFDVERWLEEPGADDVSPRAHLRAVRAERAPASSAP